MKFLINRSRGFLIALISVFSISALACFFLFDSWLSATPFLLAICFLILCERAKADEESRLRSLQSIHDAHLEIVRWGPSKDEHGRIRLRQAWTRFCDLVRHHDNEWLEESDEHFVKTFKPMYESRIQSEYSRWQDRRDR